MTLEFHCPSCNAHIQTPDSTAGKKGKCPSCSTVFDIPGPTATPGAPQSGGPAPQASGDIQFNCPHCTGVVKTPASSAGVKGKCPYCQAVVTIPMTSSPPPSSSGPSQGGGLTPLAGSPQASSGLTPISGGLTPISGGLTPIPGGLTPISDGLTPLGNNTNPPASNDPFAQLGGTGQQPMQSAGDPYSASSNPFSGTSANANPYASPATTTAYKSSREDAQNRVRVPAIALIGLSSLSVLFFLVYGIIQIASGAANPPKQMNGAEAAGFRMGFICATFAPVLINGICLAGSISMLRLRSYGSAMTAAIMAIIPCSAACLVGGIPFGIWAIVVLLSQDVKRAFT